MSVDIVDADDYIEVAERLARTMKEGVHGQA